MLTTGSAPPFWDDSAVLGHPEPLARTPSPWREDVATAAVDGIGSRGRASTSTNSNPRFCRIHTIVVQPVQPRCWAICRPSSDEAEKYATEKKFDVGVLLQSRLSPDQFRLIQQIQTACDTAKLGAARLQVRRRMRPSNRRHRSDAGRDQGAHRRHRGVSEGRQPSPFAEAAERRITQPRWNGKSLSGEEFLVQHAIPNFYFHVTTTYAILRHNGARSASATTWAPCLSRSGLTSGTVSMARPLPPRYRARLGPSRWGRQKKQDDAEAR